MSRTLQRLAMAAAAGLSVVTVMALAAIATGQASIVVTHGVSMNPVYYQGDLVVVARQPAYAVGEIVAYRRPGHADVVLHRIVGGDPGGWAFKGDNNSSIDPTRPTEHQLAGRAVLHLPQGGVWLGRLTSPTALGLVAFGLLAGGGTAAQTRRRRRNRRTAVSRHATRASSPLVVATLPPPLRTTAGVVAAVGVAGLTLGALAFSGPLTAPGMAAPQATGASMTFSYRADVGRSPAYDGTTVTAPDPVFRSRAGNVDVDYAYRGAPGSLSVTAELSTPGGWHSTVPLRGPVPTGGDYAGSVTLDLAALDARAQAASAVTGLPAGPVSVAVTPRVQPARGAAFSPTLSLALTPLQLTLSGGAADLVVTDVVSEPQSARVPRHIGAYGLKVTVATARVLAPVLCLAALLAAGLIALVGRRLAPSGEAAQILRRHRALLIRVHPMPAPAGRPVIDVTEFATLAKLAERYGLLVLHWSRSDVETFVVQDESTTYRYRPGVGVLSVDQPAAETTDLAPVD